MMDKKKVYLIQASAVYGESLRTAYLPYAAGCLAAYAWADERIRANYALGRFIFTRENIEEAVNSLDAPFLVGFSSYIWNMEYNRCFAKALRERYPQTIIVFGGHNIAPDGRDLATIPEADILMHGEGEEPFRRLLLALAGDGRLAEVPSISFRRDGEIVTTAACPPQDISAYPSPYTEGYFDELLRSSGIAPSVIWETNRGCPNHCAFCDWGALHAKVRMFPQERLEAELAWMVKNKVEYVYCADANFGIFPRDSAIADMLIESNRKTGYPAVFKTNYTKNKDDVVFAISKKLIENGIGKSPTLSFQSLSPEVLKNIGRSNMEAAHFKKLMARYSEAKVPVYSELILGLPGETYDSFTDGINTLLECNQHTCIGIYPCELLPNSLLGTAEYRNKYAIQTVKTGFTQYHIKPDSSDVPEHSNIIVSTASMSIAAWKRSFIFSICIQAFHNLALTRAFAMYLHYEKGISYKAFYEQLIAFLAGSPPETVAGKAYTKLCELTDGVAAGTHSFAQVYGEEEKLTWSFEEFLFLTLVKQADLFYDELQPFFASFSIETEIARDLLHYQRSILKKAGAGTLTLTLHYDFYTYFRRIYKDEYAPLERKENTLEISNRCIDDWDNWARICVWYGRRDDAQLYTGQKNKVLQQYMTE